MAPLLTRRDHGPRGIRAVWFLPAGHIKVAIHHVKKKWGEGEKIAVLVIPRGDKRLEQFRNFFRGSYWSNTFHPVFSRSSVEVRDEDFFIINPDAIPENVSSRRTTAPPSPLYQSPPH